MLLWTATTLRGMPGVHVRTYGLVMYETWLDQVLRAGLDRHVSRKAWE